jgi:hypothetical protein
LAIRRLSRASNRERVNLTTRSRGSVLDRDLNTFMSRIVNRRMIDDDTFVRRNCQPNVNLDSDAMTMFVAWCDNGYATSRYATRRRYLRTLIRFRLNGCRSA